MLSLLYTALLELPMTKPRGIILSLATLALLFSCSEVKFGTSQPHGTMALTEFPAALQGEYVNQDGDTLIIGQRKIWLLNRESVCNRLTEEDSLGSRTVLKPFNRHYLMNIRDDTLWSVALLTKSGMDSLLVSLIDVEDEQTLDVLSNMITMDTIFAETGEIMHFLIEPDPLTLQQMIDRGIFSDHYHFRQLPR